MEFLGVGPIEFVIIMFVVLLLLGPTEMSQTGKRLGRLLRRVVTSPEWRIFKNASKELSGLPVRLMREAGLEEIEKEQAVRQAQSNPLDNTIGLTKDIKAMTQPAAGEAEEE